MEELFSAGLFWFFILAEVFTFYMKRTFSTWQGANQIIPQIMIIISFLCTIALVVLLVFVFIKIKPFWYGLVMVVGGFIIPIIIPVGKLGEIIIAAIGMVAGPVFVVLSFLKLFAVL